MDKGNRSGKRREKINKKYKPGNSVSGVKYRAFSSA